MDMFTWKNRSIRTMLFSKREKHYTIHLFLHLKKFLSGQCERLQNDREAEMSVTQWFQSQAADLYDTGIQKLVQRQDKCLISWGEYVEKITQHLL